MHLLTQVTGQGVYGLDGRPLGRVDDLAIRLDDQASPHPVKRILVRTRRGVDLLVPWMAIERFEPTGVVMHRNFDPPTFAITSPAEALAEDEILLVRDVLDTQIVDVAGRRMARVADVILSRGANDRLELVGVDVGFGAVLRRLGLRRLAGRINEDVVGWTDLHLTSERGHAVQLATPRSAVHHLDASGLAALISRLDTDSATEILAVCGPGIAADAVRAAPAVGERVLRAMPDDAAEQIVGAMPVEHARRWRRRIAHTPALRGRHFIRSRVWPRRRRPGVTP